MAPHLLRERAPAKVNLTLHVLGRRDDGYHELDSLVAFAGCAADLLTLEPGPSPALAVSGPFAQAAGPEDGNLVLKAARALAARVEGLRTGRFALTKRVPVAAGLGGGSADAAAALRLLARANGLAADDPRLMEAATEAGSDVPVCLASRAARMAGRGERLSPVTLPPQPAVLLNPMRPVATADVFRALGLAAGGRMAAPAPAAFADPTEEIARGRNDLEAAAVRIAPEIGAGLMLVASQTGCRGVRMSGSGATVFGLFETPQAARRAARALSAAAPGWWVRSTLLR
ncbi:4-diphosphocytidyl-2-C-methyl-D-erythritol kinase [Methylopila jiangsuensis]|uniref:4-diphosphocytidyl-2-C-methyl-D-erythritol kinase n=1 Tax=Methylopila jiangsuensis TaxID=586230 RepID=A0A9W6N337_9HYPH|nr:4-(cytidine 5'-diphospho)-2-C-methyl-D-erythritol kinase [Methylopila jiangsuensis]MDR6287127.1 4-diphosphocytidyl-2-C-methyl-D-erythritol kinase [Methylopila jiangsuensis]GLK76614.1 4-diphosphocytidyl-2-C-methyl-D-erythritol kinase [Methylopila jiangsuensis]